MPAVGETVPITSLRRDNPIGATVPIASLQAQAGPQPTQPSIAKETGKGFLSGALNLAQSIGGNAVEAVGGFFADRKAERKAEIAEAYGQPYKKPDIPNPFEGQAEIARRIYAPAQAALAPDPSIANVSISPFKIGQQPDVTWQQYFAKLGRGIGETVPSAAAAAGGFAVGGPIGAGIVGGALEGLSEYEQAKQAGATEEEARRRLIGMGIGSAALNAIPFASAASKFLGTGRASILARALVGSATEGTTETLEGPLAEVVKSGTQADWDQLWNAFVKESEVALPAAISGSVTSTQAALTGESAAARARKTPGTIGVLDAWRLARSPEGRQITQMAQAASAYNAEQRALAEEQRLKNEEAQLRLEARQANPIFPFVNQHAAQYGVDPNLLFSIAEAEIDAPTRANDEQEQIGPFNIPTSRVKNRMDPDEATRYAAETLKEFERQNNGDIDLILLDWALHHNPAKPIDMRRLPGVSREELTQFVKDGVPDDARLSERDIRKIEQIRSFIDAVKINAGSIQIPEYALGREPIFGAQQGGSYPLDIPNPNAPPRTREGLFGAQEGGSTPTNIPNPQVSPQPIGNFMALPGGSPVNMQMPVADNLVNLTGIQPEQAQAVIQATERKGGALTKKEVADAAGVRHVKAKQILGVLSEMQQNPQIAPARLFPPPQPELTRGRLAPILSQGVQPTPQIQPARLPGLPAQPQEVSPNAEQVSQTSADYAGRSAQPEVRSQTGYPASSSTGVRQSGPAQTQAKEQVAQKQPYEMTREEWGGKISPVRESKGRTSIILSDGTALVGGTAHGVALTMAVDAGFNIDEITNGTAGFTTDKGVSWDISGKPVETKKTVNLADINHKNAVDSALQSGDLTPARARELGHFDTYPDLAAKYGQAQPAAKEPLTAPAPSVEQQAPAESGTPETKPITFKKVGKGLLRVPDGYQGREIEIDNLGQEPGNKWQVLLDGQTAEVFPTLAAAKDYVQGELRQELDQDAEVQKEVIPNEEEVQGRRQEEVAPQPESGVETRSPAPEQALQSETAVTMPEIPSGWQPSAPKKGSPELAELQSKHDAYSDIAQQEYNLQQQSKAMPWGSKKRAVAEKKADKLREKLFQISEEGKRAGAMIAQSHLEDLVVNGDAAQRLAALEKLGLKKGTWEDIKAAMSARAQELGYEPNDAAILDAASMISSYPGIRGMDEQIKTSYSISKSNRVKSEAYDYLAQFKSQMGVQTYEKFKRRAEWIEEEQIPEFRREVDETVAKINRAQEEESAKKAKEEDDLLRYNAENRFYGRFGDKFADINATKLRNKEFSDFDLAIGRDGDKWAVTEAISGLRLATADTRADVVKKTKELVASSSGKIRAAIDNAIKEGKTSPRHQAQQQQAAPAEGSAIPRQGPQEANLGMFEDIAAAAKEGKRFVQELYDRVRPALSQSLQNAIQRGQTALQWAKEQVKAIGSHIAPYVKRVAAEMRRVASDNRGAAITPKGIMAAVKESRVGKAAKRNLSQYGEAPKEVSQVQRGARAEQAGEVFEAKDKGSAMQTLIRNKEVDEATVAKALTGDKVAKASLPETARTLVTDMRSHVTALQKRLAEHRKAQGNAGQAATILRSVGTYLHRSYKMFDPATTKDDWMKKIKAMPEWDQMAQKVGGHTQLNQIFEDFFQTKDNMRTGKVGRADMSALLERKVKDPLLRKLMGEKTNPVEQYLDTIVTLSQDVAMFDMQKTLLEHGKGKWLWDAKSVPQGKVAGGQPVLVGGANNEKMGYLAGMYATPEVARVFNELVRTQNQVGAFWKAVYAYDAYSKASKTSWNAPTGAIRQLWSDVMFVMSTGNTMRALKNLPKAARYTLLYNLSETLAGYKLTSPAAKKVLYKLAKRGIFDTEVVTGQIGEELAMMGVFQDVDVTRKNFIRRLGSALTTFYRTADNMTKVAAFYAIQDQYKNYAKKQGMTQEQLEDLAADMTMRWIPNNGLTNEVARSAGRNFFLSPFLRFHVSTMFAAGNVVTDTAREIASGDPELRKIAVKRIPGIIGGMGLAVYGLEALSKMLYGISDDEEKVIRESLPDWSKNSTGWFARDKDGRPIHTDTQYMQGYPSTVGLAMNVLTSDSPQSAFDEFKRGMAETFLQGSMIIPSLMTLFFGRDPETGREVILDENDWRQNMEAIAKTMLEPVLPGGKSYVRLYKALTTGKYYDQPVTPRDEFNRILSGFTITQPDPIGAFVRDAAAYNFNRNWSGVARNLVESGRMSQPDAVREINRRRKEEFNKLAEQVRSMVRANPTQYSRTKIKRALRKAGFGDETARAIVYGRYRKYEPKQE